MKMSNACRILLVSKTSKVSLLSEEDLQRLQESGAADADQLRQGHTEHNTTLDVIRTALKGHEVCERRIEDVHTDDIIEKDLVITVGGDGTVLAVSGMVSNIPILSVNSDPTRSIGNYTRCTRDGFADTFIAYLQGNAHIENIPRLKLEIEGDRLHYPILNDCLFTNQNPAAMTKYTICVDDHVERQYSSGVWVSTGAGSTGAIHSAGMASVAAHEPALLFKVREPFTRHGQISLTEGCQLPPRGLTLTPGLPGIQVFIDGAHQCKAIPPGTCISFSAYTHDLQLITPK